MQGIGGKREGEVVYHLFIGRRHRDGVVATALGYW